FPLSPPRPDGTSEPGIRIGGGVKITQIDLWHASIPLERAFYPSWIPGFPQTENRFTLVRLRTASGLEGWSAGAALSTERAGQVRCGAERVREIEARLAEGCNAVKLRVHDETLEQDVQQLKDARKGVGDAPVLGVDANQAWRVAVVANAPKWSYERAHAFCSE